MRSGYTHLAMVLDRSGSMATIVDDMNPAINKFLAEQDEEPGDVLVDVTLFDSVVEFPYSDVGPSDIREDLIEPRGTTSLNDALGVTIKRLGRKFALMAEDDRPEHVIFVVVTDGMENSSVEYTTAQVKAMVDTQTNQWNWKFIFMAANVDAFKVGGQYGFAKGQTIDFAASGVGTQNVYASASRTVSGLRTGQDTSFTDDDREEAMGS